MGLFHLRALGADRELMNSLTYRANGRKENIVKFTTKKGDTSTIRKVWSNDKEVCYGIVGTVGDLLTAKILTYCDYKEDGWAFLHPA
jgi:hypothetical protein